jgi:hypothetical protein
MTYFSKELKPFVGPALQVGFLPSAIIMVNKLREIWLVELFVARGSEIHKFGTDCTVLRLS